MNCLRKLKNGPNATDFTLRRTIMHIKICAHSSTLSLQFPLNDSPLSGLNFIQMAAYRQPGTKQAQTAADHYEVEGIA